MPEHLPRPGTKVAEEGTDGQHLPLGAIASAAPGMVLHCSRGRCVFVLTTGQWELSAH